MMARYRVILDSVTKRDTPDVIDERHVRPVEHKIVNGSAVPQAQHAQKERKVEVAV